MRSVQFSDDTECTSEARSRNTGKYHKSGTINSLFDNTAIHVDPGAYSRKKKMNGCVRPASHKDADSSLTVRKSAQKLLMYFVFNDRLRCKYSNL